MNWPKIVSTFKLVMKKGGVNENSVDHATCIRWREFRFSQLFLFCPPPRKNGGDGGMTGFQFKWCLK